MNNGKTSGYRTDAAGNIVIQESILGPAAWGSRKGYQHPMDATHQQIAPCPAARVAGGTHRVRSTQGADRGTSGTLRKERFRQ